MPTRAGKQQQSSQRFNGTSGGIQRSLDLFSKKPDQETTQTYTWILSHLEIDPNVSLPKQEVYDEYRAFCQANRFEPLCVADFGKAMKHAFPCIKPRRLGQRGNSRYCYSGLRKKYKIQPPNLPDIQQQQQQQQQGGEQILYCNASNCDGQTNNNTSGTSNNSNNNNNGGSSSSSSSNVQYNQSSNGNNMTSANTSSTKAESAADRKRQAVTNNYNRPEGESRQHSSRLSSTRLELTHQLSVMNLKIEPNTNPGVIQFSDEPVKQHQLTDYSFQPHLSHHHNQQQQQQHSATTSSTSSYDGLAPFAGQHHSRYTTGPDYRGIQQPGTPDDDDYRHNYQDMLSPLTGHFLTSSSTSSLQLAHSSPLGGGTGFAAAAAYGGHQHCPAPGEGNGFANQPMSSHCVPTTSSSMTTLHHHHQPQQLSTTAPLSDTNNCDADNKYISNVLQSQPPFNNSAMPATQPIGTMRQHPAALVLAGGAPSTSGGGMHLLQHQMMSVNHSMETCASPFQSPASTPYPSMSASSTTSSTAASSIVYPSQSDMMQQDYCTSGCRVYQTTTN